MKKMLFSLMFLSSFSAFAEYALICESEHAKYGMGKDSDELFISELEVSDQELFQDTYVHGRIGMKYHKDTNSFTGGGEDGCTFVSYHTEVVNGVTYLIESLD